MEHVGNVSLIVMGAINILWGLVAIAALYLVIRVSRQVEPALDRAEAAIAPAMRKTHEILGKVSGIADTVTDKADRVHDVLVRVDETTARAQHSAQRASAAINRRLIPVKAFVVAVRTGTHVLAQEFSHGRRPHRPAARPAATPKPIPSESWRAA